MSSPAKQGSPAPGGQSRGSGRRGGHGRGKGRGGKSRSRASSGSKARGNGQNEEPHPQKRSREVGGISRSADTFWARTLSVLGLPAEVETTDGSVYGGYVTSFGSNERNAAWDGGVALALPYLKSARGIPPQSDPLCIHGSDVVQLCTFDSIDLDSAAHAKHPAPARAAMPTDAAIGAAQGTGAGRQRKLVPFSQPGSSRGVSLDDLGSEFQGSWDQFSVHQKKHGATSAFPEDLYSVRIDSSSVTEAQRRTAGEIAARIEGKRGRRNGQRESRPAATEEEKFASVRRPADKNVYVPPALRGSPAHAAGPPATAESRGGEAAVEAEEVEDADAGLGLLAFISGGGGGDGGNDDAPEGAPQGSQRVEEIEAGLRSPNAAKAAPAAQATSASTAPAAPPAAAAPRKKGLSANARAFVPRNRAPRPQMGVQYGMMQPYGMVPGYPAVMQRQFPVAGFAPQPMQPYMMPGPGYPQAPGRQ